MKKTLIIIFFVLVFSNLYSQSANKIFTSDIDNFWIAFDSIQQANEYSKKIHFINKLYIEKETKGLKAFMKSRNYSDTLYVKLIEEYPKFWASIRPNTLTIKNKVSELNKGVENLKKRYPNLKDAEMYFTIGGLRSGGTVVENMVLIGTEIATGTPNVNVSEFKNDWLKSTFAKQSLDDIIYINIHEYIHTQQKENNSYQLLNQAIKEGSCDFIAELVLDKPIQKPYMSYGRQYFDKLKEQFKKEMFLGYQDNWLYNGLQKGDSADLGYFIGYEICKAYYQQAKNKKQAIKNIIELDYSSNRDVESFLIKSKFYKSNTPVKI